MKTACEHCVFAVKKDGVQTGCRLGRLKIFQERQQVELQPNGFYLLNELCNTCRNIYWNEYIVNKDMNALRKLVLQEVELRYDILLNIDNATVEQIVWTIDYANRQAIKPHKIVLLGKLTDENVLKANHFLGNTICSLTDTDDVFSQSQKYIYNSGANYLLFVEAGRSFKCPLKKLDRMLNLKLKPTMYINDKNYFLTAKFLYQNNIYEPNPLTAITTRYNEDGSTKSQHTDS